MGNSCCKKEEAAPKTSCCDTQEVNKADWLLRVTASGVFVLYLLFLLGESGSPEWLVRLSGTSYEMMNTMWWGLLLAALFVGLLEKIPQQWVMAVLGRVIA